MRSTTGLADRDVWDLRPATGATGKAGTTPVTGPERRRSPRTTADAPATLTVISDSPAPGPRDVRLRDISLTGAGLVCSDRLVVGSLHFIEVNAGPLHLSSRCRIVRVRERADSGYDVGCDFC